MALIVAAGSRNETQKLVAETVEGMREVKWPQNAGTVASPQVASTSRHGIAVLAPPVALFLFAYYDKATFAVAFTGLDGFSVPLLLATRN